jgi:2-methylfumaryl-CoA hydratase
VSGITLEDSDHMFSTRLYQNTARVHFDAFAGKDTRFGRRLAYGGHVISLMRALSFNGLANGFRSRPFNAGSHVGPTFGGDTILRLVGGAGDGGAARAGTMSEQLRVRSIAAKDCPCGAWPGKGEDGKYHPAVVLDLDYKAAHAEAQLPRKAARQADFRLPNPGLNTRATPTFVDLMRLRANKSASPIFGH